MSAKNPSKQSKKVVIVGGGPCGTLCAHLLAQSDLNWDIEVYEKRPLYDNSIESTKRRPYSIVLNPRGMHYLEKSGIKLSKDVCIPLNGVVTNPYNGKPTFRPREGSAAITRTELASILHDASLNKNHSRILYNFDWSLDNVDFDNNLASFVYVGTDKAQEGRHNVRFDLLIGADGVHSKVRELLSQTNKQFHFYQKEHTNEYKVVHVPIDVLTDQNFQKSMNAWLGRNDFQVLGFPASDPSLFLLVLIVPKGKFQTFNTINDLKNYLQIHCPKQLYQYMKSTEFLEDLFHQGLYSGCTTICSDYTDGKKTVLLGDAAHSMWPTLGQGCNTSIESTYEFISILIQTLTINDENESLNEIISKSLIEYSKKRKPSAEAIGRLSESTFQHGYGLFVLKQIGLSTLHTLLPWFYEQPAYPKLRYPEHSFEDLEKQLIQQEKRLKYTLTGLSVSSMLMITGLILYKYQKH